MALHLHLLLPEILVAVAALAVVAADVLVPADRRARVAPVVAGLGLACAFAVLLLARPEGDAVLGHFSSDAFSRFVRILATGGGLLLVALSSAYTRRMDRGHGEFYGILLLALTGVMLVSGVQDLMSLFVSLELVTVLSYVLAAFKRNDLKSTEAGLKYLVIGAVSSALLLLGIALVYGASGTVAFEQLSAHVTGKGFGPLLTLGTALLLVGLFFKCAAVPFQVWAPDVYEGAPAPVTAFLSSFSKSAGFVLVLRAVAVLVVPAAGTASGDAWGVFFAGIAGLTILYGNLGAMPQTDVKRLLAYSSIGHAGYLMMGVAVVAAATTPATRAAGATSVLVYLFFYYLTMLLAFAVVVSVSARGAGHDARTSYAGLHRRSPLLALAMLLALLSMAGVPPLAGLIGKFLAFYALVDAATAKPWLVGLGVVGALGIVLSLYYYLRLIRELFVSEPTGDAEPIAPTVGVRLVVAAGIATLIGLGVWWEPVHTAAARAAEALLAAR
jgi:NADH-quinone oxidoreductase subunit N